MKYIELTQGYKTMLDDEDYEVLKKYKWHVRVKRHTAYAVAYVNGKNTLMHRIIMNVVGSDQQIDHKDRNGLNNQRSNLRTCTASQNCFNRVQTNKKNRGTCHFIDKRINKSRWLACVYKNGHAFSKRCHTEIEAAIAYNELAIKHHGEFAQLNTIPDQTQQDA